MERPGGSNIGKDSGRDADNIDSMRSIFFDIGHNIFEKLPGSVSRCVERESSLSGASTYLTFASSTNAQGRPRLESKAQNKKTKVAMMVRISGRTFGEMSTDSRTWKSLRARIEMLRLEECADPMQGWRKEPE